MKFSFLFLCALLAGFSAESLAQSPGVVMEEMTSAEIDQVLKGGVDTAIVAVGATEQHGKHMATASDSVIGEYLAKTVAEKLGRALAAPSIRVGMSGYHMQFPGTIQTREDVLEALLRDYVFSLAWQGFHHIVILPTHAGNFDAVEQAGRQLSRLYPHIDIIVMNVQGFRDALQTTSKRLGIDERRNGAHAGLSETSMVLAIRPDLVHMEKAEQGYMGDVSSAAKKMKEEGTDVVSANGVVGDPRGATAQVGREYLKDLTSYLVGYIQTQRDRWKPSIPSDLHMAKAADPKGPLAEGIQYRRDGAYDKASSFFAKRIQADPKDSGAALELAKTYMLDNQFTEAGKLLSSLLSHPSEEVRYQALDKLGEVDLMQGQFYSAIRHKEEARKLRVRAGDPIGEARKFMWVGYIEVQVGLYKDAEDALRSGLKLTPSPNDARAGGLDETAASGRSPLAGGATDTYIDLEEVMTGLDINRSRLLQAAGHLRSLEDVAIQPGLADKIRIYYRMHGLLLLERHRFDDAIINLSIAARMNDSPGYELGLGRAYLEAGRLPEAEARFRQLIDLRGDSRLHTPDQYVMGYFFLGRTYEKMGRKADAEAMYRKFLSFWGQADIELPAIAEAKARLAN